MSNNLDITINDFENICRTCLSREDLKPLYETFVQSTCLVDMLKSCTFVKFVEDDGLPVKICTNCIKEINQAFSFAKRCEATDAFLRQCAKIEKEAITESKKEIKLEIQPESVWINSYQAEEECASIDEIKQEKNVDVEQDEDVKIEIHDHFVEDSEMLDETYSKKSDNFDFRPQEASTNDQDRSLLAKRNRSDVKGLKNHREEIEHVQNGETLNVCSVCSKTFSTSKKLKIHMRIHTGKKSNFCYICSKSLGTTHDLKRHMRIHTGEKPYVCEVCKKAFLRKSNLISHSRIHTGEKLNVCYICSKSLGTSHDLKRHLRIHTGEKPYTCEVCNKAFSVASNLKTHLRIHTGEKPNVCSICSKSFVQSENLKNHMRTHTGEKPYTCEICNKTFSHISRLKSHWRIHARKKPNPNQSAVELLATAKTSK